MTVSQVSLAVFAFGVPSREAVERVSCKTESSYSDASSLSVDLRMGFLMRFVRFKGFDFITREGAGLTVGVAAGLMTVSEAGRMVGSGALTEGPATGADERPHACGS